MIYFIYVLIDPRTDQPFYVGLTGDPNTRLSKHRTEKGGTRKNTVIDEIHLAGLQPQMNIVEIIMGDLAIAREKEQSWIKTYMEQGILLSNV